MTGGQALVRSLEAHGVTTVFGIPGTHNLAVYDALLDSPIHHVSARHEQGAAFMADGYARAGGQVGVCLSTTGPAALNTLTPLGTAYSDSSRVLCIASQIQAEFLGREKRPAARVLRPVGRLPGSHQVAPDGHHRRRHPLAGSRGFRPNGFGAAAAGSLGDPL